MKRYSTSLIVSEMQIQTTARYHLMLVRMAIIKMTANNKCWKVLVAQVMFDSFFATPWTVACQAPLSMRFSRQEYWSGLPFPPPGDFLNPSIEPASSESPALIGIFFTTRPTWEAQYHL